MLQRSKAAIDSELRLNEDQAFAIELQWKSLEEAFATICIRRYSYVDTKRRLNSLDLVGLTHQRFE
jgi:hypothetical protein